MTAENQNSANPEGLSLDEVLGEYIAGHNERMHDITEMHGMAAASLQHNYETQVSAANTQTAPFLFLAMERKAAEVLRATPGAVAFEMSNAATALADMLSDEDRDLLNGEVAEQIRTFGLGSEYVKQAKAKATSPTAEQALDVILDTRVTGHMLHEADTFGLGSGYVAKAIKLGSSPEVRKALRASMDAQVLDYARHEAHTFGVDSEYLTKAIKLGSSEEVRKVLKGSFDGMALINKHHEASTFGDDDQAYVAKAARQGSSPQVNALLKNSPSTPRALGEHNPYPTSRDYRFNGEDEPIHDRSYGLVHADIYRDFFESRPGTYQVPSTANEELASDETLEDDEVPAARGHRAERRSKPNRRRRIALRAGAVVAAGAALFGMRAAAGPIVHAYEHHQAGVERTYDRNQHQLGRIIQPELNKLGNAYVAAEHKDHKPNEFSQTRLPDGNFVIKALGNGAAIMGAKTVYSHGKATQVPNPNDTKFASYITGFESGAPDYTLTAPGGFAEAVKYADQIDGIWDGGDPRGYAALEGFNDSMSRADSTRPDGINYDTPAQAASGVVGDMENYLQDEPPFSAGA
jgi:hypothetical protein